MGIGSFFRKLTGGGAGGGDKTGDAVDYNGYTIIPQPKSQGGQYLTAGVIRKAGPDGGDAPREKAFIRADTHTSFDAACAHTVQKGQQIIDEQGERLFD